jgi:hypothetical protein
LLFEVKGFEPHIPAPGFGSVDPYPPLRRKINKAIEKFKDLEEYSCSLVLHYAGPGLIFLEPPFIFGAMLGDVGFEVPIDLGRATPKGDVNNVFTKRGRMIQYGKGGTAERPQNTTINAIVVVEHYALGRRRFMTHLGERERTIGRRLTDDEFADELATAEGTDRDVSTVVVRAVVHENPYARIPLPRGIFVGSYDERYGPDGGRITRVFAGEVVGQLGESSM